MEKIAILFNPSSGRGRSLREKGKILKTLRSMGLDYDFFQSESEAHLEQLTVETGCRYGVVVAVGGDTTLKIVAAKLLDLDCPTPVMGMIGTGSANDIVQGLGIQKIRDACAAIKKNTPKKMDVGRLEIHRTVGDTPTGSYYFLGSVSAGLGTRVNQYVARYYRNHKYLQKIKPFDQFLPGLWGVRDSFARKKLPVKAALHYWNGKENHRDLHFSLMVLLNAPTFANGMRVGSANGLFDGMVECCVLETRSLWSTFRLGMKIKNGASLRPHENVSFMNAASFKVTADEPLDILVDGDVICGLTDFEVSTLHGGLKVLI